MSRPMSTQLPAAASHARLDVDYVQADSPDALLRGDDVLAVFGFGNAAPRNDDPRYLRVPLQPHGGTPFEIWRTRSPVSHGREDGIAWASDGQLSFGAIEIDEHEIGIEAAAERAYSQLLAFVGRSATPRLLRIWNYLDAITLGDGDTERYRRFCVGRARGMGDFDTSTLPAATAIGRCDDERVIQVYWLSAREAGTPVENPRQVSAYHYPRQYGRQSPSFARAMLPPPGGSMPLLLSGTASVVGHRSLHAGQLQAQLEETFANFDSLIGAARVHAPALPAHFGADSRLKVYVRERDDLPLVARAFAERFNGGVPHMILHAVICRRDLAVEIDGVHGTLPVAFA